MYRVPRLSPQTNPNRSAIRVVVSQPGIAPSPENFDNIQVWRSWVEFDSQVERRRPRSRVNWDALLGLTMTASISLGFWAGVGVLAAQIWK